MREIVRVVAAMAIRALEHGIVIRVRVARGADTVGVAVIDRELCVLGVIESRTRPGGSVVAVLARSREELRLRRVARICRVVVVGLVASDAGRGQRRVVAVDVAIGALARRNRVRSRQRERRVVVVERRIRPDGRVVAQFARSGESGGGVRGTRGAGVILLMARVTQGAVQRIVVVDVAIGAGAGRYGVRAGQLEAGGCVIESGVGPENRVVARFTSGREGCRNVVHRSCRVVVVGLVARDARRSRQVVVVIDVAIGASARRNRMGTAQREPGGVVIESSIEPRARAVALVASLREVRRDVVRVRRALIILQVTAYASCRIQAVVIVDVAIGTGTRRYGVQSGKRESRAVVIECRVHPAGGVVTLIAGLREVSRHVIRVRRALIIL